MVYGVFRKSGDHTKNYQLLDASRGRSRRCNLFLFLLISAFVWQLMFWSNWDLLQSPTTNRGPCSSSWLSGNDFGNRGGLRWSWDIVTLRRDNDFLRQAREGEFTLASTNRTAPLLVVHCYHGLANRLRALASAMAVAHATGRQLQVVWVPDAHIEAKFHDLFENKFVVWNNLEAVTSRADWRAFDKYNYMENEEGSEKYKYINTSSPAHIYAKSAYILAHVNATEDEVARQFNHLVPSKAVRHYLQPFRSQVCRGWAPCSSYIAVHVRHANPLTELKEGDLDMYTSDAWKTTIDMREMSHPVHFVSELRRILMKSKSMQVFVSTDSQTSLQPFIDAFEDRVLFLDKRGCFDRSPKCSKLALADLLLLGHSSHDYILGSFWSSFTEVATYPRRLQVKYAGVDFMAPGKHPHKCGVANLDSAGSFEGVAVVAAAQGRADVLQRTVPTWLAEEGVSEVILVDWSSNPPLRETLNINDTRLRIVEVKGADSWILTRAFNIGFRHSSARRILKIDADTEIFPGTLEEHPLEAGLHYAGNWQTAKDENGRHLNGIFYVHRNDLIKINGFDERIETYGWDDEDIFGRLKNSGVKRRDLNLDYFHHVEHVDSKRMQQSRSVTKCTDVEMLRNRDLVRELPFWGINSTTIQLKCKEMEQLTCRCTIATSPLGLVEYLPPDFVQNVTLAAYRTVAAYTGDFDSKSLEQVTSFKWYEMFLRRHFHTEDRYVVVKPRGSVAERLVGMQCGLDLAQRWGWKVHIAWKQEQPCLHAFEDLFSNNTLEVVPEFYDFELSWRYKAVYMDHGTDWVSETTPAPKGANVLVVTHGAFGGCASSVRESLWRSLVPTKLGKSLQPSFSAKVPTPPVLILKLKGTIMQRISGLASAIQLGRTFSRHIVLVWDPSFVGGLLLRDLFQNLVHEVSSVQEYLESSKEGGLETYVHNVSESVKGIDWSRRENVVVDLTGRLVGEGSEDEFNTILRGLVPSQELVDEMMGLQVGKGFHGFIVGDHWDGCEAKGAVSALKEAYVEKNPKGKAHLFVLAESQEVCDEAGNGIICVAMCGGNLGKACLMKHVASVLVLSKLPQFFFLDWRHREVEVIMRQGQKHSKKVDCSFVPHDTNAAPISLARELNARMLSKALERPRWSCNGTWHLLLQIPIEQEAGDDYRVRNDEYWDTLAKNLEHPEVKKIHIFTDEFTDESTILAHVVKDPCHKIRFVPLKRRLFYNDTFAYANAHLSGEACAVLNADIYLGEGFGSLDLDVHMHPQRVLALSRFEKQEGETCGYSICTRYKNDVTGYLSHDTFLFRSPLPPDVVARTGFFQQVGSENVLVHILKENNIDVRNPCRSLKTYHNHCSGIRHWRTNDTAKSWESSLNMNERIDIKYCNKVHCGNGWVEQGPEVIQDLE